MHSFKQRHFHAFRADATALGGFLRQPLQKSIPTLAPVCLPAAGGFASARSEAFNLDEVVSVSSAYTLVSGRESREEGAISTLVTAVVENLNILEVVTAKRIVAQISVTSPLDGGPQRISLGGSRFEKLRFLGRDASLTVNAGMSEPEAGRRRDGVAVYLAELSQVCRRAGRDLDQSLHESRGQGRHRVGKEPTWLEDGRRSCRAFLRGRHRGIGRLFELWPYRRDSGIRPDFSRRIVREPQFGAVGVDPRGIGVPHHRNM